MSDLFEKIEEYVYSDEYSFSVPGHKRNYFVNDFFTEFYKHDITYLEEFESENAEEGYIHDCLSEVEKVFESYESFYVNDDLAVLIALSAAVKKGGNVLAMRNSGRAFYKAAYLRELNVKYLYGECDTEIGVKLGITIEQIEYAINNNPDIDAVFLTSPTIQGMSSEIDDIAEFLHEKHIPLIVDASYGTHFGFADFLPSGAVNDGADIVIHGPYKSLPAPTGTGILHVNGEIVDVNKIRFFVNLYTPDFPSYFLKSCTDHLISCIANGSVPWKKYFEKREEFSKKLENLQNIGCFEAFTKDKFVTPELGKVVIDPKTGRVDGKMLYERLKKEFHLRPLLAAPSYVLLNFTVSDTDEAYERMAEALIKIDDELSDKVNTAKQFSSKDLGNLESLFGVKSSITETNLPKSMAPANAEIAMSIAEATEMEKESVRLLMAENRICGCTVDIYPYTEPILVPGEIINKQALMLITFYQKHKFEVSGVFMDRIEVLREKKETKND